jgi:chorismate mutase
MNFKKYVLKHKYITFFFIIFQISNFFYIFANMNEILPLFPGLEAKSSPLIIAGPCSAENEKQVLATATSLAENGIKIFRAGLWKPRTRPGSFEGVGATGLKWLREVKTKTNMKVITEVGCRAHLLSAVKGGVDGIWIGARTTTNPFAVQEIADTIKELKCDIAVLVKNPVNTDLQLWIGAIERFYRAGVKRLAAIHRGFSSYGELTYRNSPHWEIPIELHRRMPQLPILHDPSHTAGRADMIDSLCRQAIDLCFDGLMIEVHNDPQLALSDASQQITPSQLADILSNLSPHTNKSCSQYLSAYRSRIDNIDEEIISLLAKRMKICNEIGEFKNLHGMTVVQADRYAELIADRLKDGELAGLDSDFLKKLFTAIHTESVRLQLMHKPTKS